MNMHDYIIADIRLRSTADIVELGVRGFKPFEVEYNGSIDADCTFDLRPSMRLGDFVVEKHLADFTAIETGAHCELKCTTNGYLYTIARHDSTSEPTLFHIERNTFAITSNIECNTMPDVAQLRFALWVMFGVVLSTKQAIAIHSSTIECGGRCILFLGESGTGKSTHTRLWRENIEGAKLLNDDSPIIRIIDGKAIVFGSPWSGKTPCYKNLSYPIAGFCRLSQAPHNAIRRLPTIAAIGALLPSCPPAFAHDEELQDMICNTLGEMLRRIPAYHLECLPNAEAAQLSRKTILGDE